MTETYSHSSGGWKAGSECQRGGVPVGTLLLGPSHGGVQGRHRREQLSPASSHKGCKSFHGALLTTSPNPTDFPRAPPPNTITFKPRRIPWGPGHRRLSVSHFPVCKGTECSLQDSPEFQRADSTVANQGRSS